MRRHTILAAASCLVLAAAAGPALAQSAGPLAVGATVEPAANTRARQLAAARMV